MPNTEVLQSLKREAKELKAKFEAINSVIALYAEDEPASTAVPPPKPPPGRIRRRITGNQRSDPILDAAAEVLALRTAPMRTSLLLKHLNRRNLEIHGKVPQNTLSARLSNSPRFRSHGRSGWTMAPTSHPEAKQGEAPDDSSSEASDVGWDSGPTNPLFS